MKSPSWCTGNRPRSVAPSGQSKYLLVAFPGVNNQLSSLSSTKSQLNPGQKPHPTSVHAKFSLQTR